MVVLRSGHFVQVGSTNRGGRMCRAVVVFLATIVCMQAYSGVYTGEIVFRIRRDLHERAGEDIRSRLTRVNALQADDAAKYREELVRWQEEDGLDFRLRTLLLAELAADYQRSNEHPKSVRILREIVDLNATAEGRVFAYYAELEILRMMNQSGGHSRIPNFNPPFKEKEDQLKRILDAYGPYHEEVLSAYIAVAEEAYVHLVFDDDAYAGEAVLRWLDEMERVVAELQKDPTLAVPPIPADKLKMLKSRMIGTRRTMEMRMEKSEFPARPARELESDNP